MPRFAANLTMMYAEYQPAERFAAAAADGFTAVEYLFPYPHTPKTLAGWLQGAGLQQILLNAPPGNWEHGERGLACLPGKEAHFQTSIHAALEYAAAICCPRVHVMAGLQPAGAERATLRQTYVDNLAWAAGVAATGGVTLLIEPINTRDIPAYFLNHQQEAHDIVAEIGSHALKVQMDLYHCQIVEGDVGTRLRRYLQGTPNQVGHIQVASVPDRNEPGSGELDYGYLFDLIDELGYEGWIGCEYRPKGGTREGLGWLRRWQRAQPASPTAG